jgi:hypothetical protein
VSGKYGLLSVLAANTLLAAAGSTDPRPAALAPIARVLPEARARFRVEAIPAAGQ